jgi:outer membrane protein TolC
MEPAGDARLEKTKGGKPLPDATTARRCDRPWHGQRRDLLITNTTVDQPLTQLIKLRAARRAAQAEVKASQADLRKAENEVALQVRQVYIEILIGRLEMQAMVLQVSASEQSLKESTYGVSTGNLPEVAALGRKTKLLQSKYQLSKLENQISDLTGDLSDLIGLPIDTELELEPISIEVEPLFSLAAYRELGINQNPEIQAAMQAAEKARQGVRIAKADHIPDVGVFAQYTYQNGVPFLVHNNGSVGLRMSWKVFDWGKRSAAIGEAEAQLTEVAGRFELFASEGRIGCRDRHCTQIKGWPLTQDRRMRSIWGADHGYTDLADYREFPRPWPGIHRSGSQCRTSRFRDSPQFR